MTAGTVVSFLPVEDWPDLCLSDVDATFGAAPGGRSQHAPDHGCYVAAVHGADGGHQSVHTLHNPDLPLAMLVERAVEDIRPQAMAAGVQLELNNEAIQAAVRGDAGRLVQSLGYLLSNALKFSPRGSMVKVGLSRHDANICIAVVEQGPGVSDNFRDRLFQPFSSSISE